MVDNKFLVSIRCMTYNQSAYITDAMDGFVMQQTNFPFVAIIMDDASTDGEQDIILRYLEEGFLLSNDSCKRWETEEAQWVFAQHRTNLNCCFVVSLLKRNLYKKRWIKLNLIKEWEEGTKYIALCEGDDYWTDPIKLQRQVLFLEEHMEYSASTENGLVFYTSDQSTSAFSEGESKDVTFDELLIKRRFPTASVVYRSCYNEGLEKLLQPGFDTLYWAYLSKQGKIHYNSVISSVYRRGSGITSNDRIKWAYTVRSFNISLNKNFCVPDEINKIRKRDVFENILEGLKEAKRQKRYADMFRLFCYGMELFPKRMLKLFVKSLK